MTPELTTARLTLKPYYAGMVSDTHVRWLNDQEVVKYSEQRHKRHTLETTHAYVNELRTTPGSHLWGIYIFPFEREQLIGTISAHTDVPNSVSNVGIMIGIKSEWGRGYGHEAWNSVCDWLFRQGVRKIEMGCHYENRAMRKLAERSGMVMEGVRHDHFVVNGEPQHLLLYGKMRPANAQVVVNEQSAGVLG